MPQRTLSVQLVFANYHCADEITHCIRTLAGKTSSTRLDIVVVNNGGRPFSSDGTSDTESTRVRVLDPEKNVGYFGAFSSALEADLDDRTYDFRILCNPDIEFRDPKFFGRLARLELDGKTALIAPTVISGITGRDQNPFLVVRPTTSRRLRWRAAYLCLATYILREWLSDRFHHKQREPGPAAAATATVQKPAEIYAGHGAFIIFTEAFLQHARRELLQVPFLYAEELFIGEICYQLGWSVKYRPELQVCHQEHAVTATLAARSRYRFNRDATLAYIAFAKKAD